METEKNNVHIAITRFRGIYGDRDDPRFMLEALDAEDAVLGRIIGDPVTGFVIFQIARPHRRRGIGTSLLKEYIRFVETETDIPRLRFTVSKANPGAIGLYRKLGFDVREFGDLAFLECLKLKLREPPVPSDSLPL